MVLPELKFAVQEKGYRLLAVHEVYQYPGTMKFNPKTGEDGLLSGFIRTFMAVKIQASGWPVECDSEEKKQKYVADVAKYDGITIDPMKIQKNPGLRTIGKLCANSYWGKLGEKTLRPKAELIYNYEDLIRLITDPTKIISALMPLGDECLQINWRPHEDTEESLPTSSLIHAAFTTCYGRLHIYKFLSMVGKNALYGDTDSVAFISRRENQSHPSAPI